MMKAERALYRARQFWLALTAAPDAAQLRQARRVLPPALMRLFLRMTPDEQAHALRVLESVQAQGGRHPAVLQAALLHDAGKAAQPPLRLWERVAIVLAGAALGGEALSRLGRGEARGWRRPFVVAAQHPAWGARMAREAGASPLVVELIRRHQQPLEGPPQNEFERLLLMLQAADDAN